MNIHHRVSTAESRETGCIPYTSRANATTASLARLAPRHSDFTSVATLFPTVVGNSPPENLENNMLRTVRPKAGLLRGRPDINQPPYRLAWRPRSGYETGFPHSAQNIFQITAPDAPKARC